MYRIEYFGAKKKPLGHTWYSSLKRQAYGLDGMIMNGMGRLKISGKVESFRMYWPGETTFEYCGSI
jgi:hypothetical protein